MTLTDTGPLVALVNKGDAGHSVCRNTLPNLSGPLVTTWPCVTEAMYLLGQVGGYRYQNALWQMWAGKKLVVHDLSLPEIQRMQTLMDTYRDAPMDLADASVVAAAESMSLRRIFTLDRHFYAYRTANGQALEVVP